MPRKEIMRSIFIKVHFNFLNVPESKQKSQSNMVSLQKTAFI